MSADLRKIPGRFYSLDVLRGVAALTIVFWHWKHFFFVGTSEEGFDEAALPFHDLLRIFYTKGWLAVDLFFALSGFIFFWLYSQRIKSKEVQAGRFFRLRFSRLYPLHAATLLIVLVGQLIYFKIVGNYFVYEYNDVKHFVLNVLFATSWGLEDGFSFNQPIWSVSIEVLLYTIFFVYCRLLPLNIPALLATSFFGFLFVAQQNILIGRGIGSYFIGGVVFLIYRQLLSSERLKLYCSLMASLTVLAWLITFWQTALAPASSSSTLDFEALAEFAPWLAKKIIYAWPTLILFPSTILTLALMETLRPNLGKRLSVLGDISYSTYLIHFPLQLFFVIFSRYLGYSNSIYSSPWVMLMFFVILIPISYCSYYYYERRMQKVLR